MQCYQKALAKAEKLYGKGRTAAAMIYTSMGSLFLKKGDKFKAAGSFVKSSEFLKKSMGAIVRPKADRLLLVRAGFIYYDANSYQQAWKTLEKAPKDIVKFTPNERRIYMPRFYRYLALAFLGDNKFLVRVLIKLLQWLRNILIIYLSKYYVTWAIQHCLHI